MDLLFAGNDKYLFQTRFPVDHFPDSILSRLLYFLCQFATFLYVYFGLNSINPRNSRRYYQFEESFQDNPTHKICKDFWNTNGLLNLGQRTNIELIYISEMRYYVYYLHFSNYYPHLCRHVYHDVSAVVRSGLLQGHMVQWIKALVRYSDIPK